MPPKKDQIKQDSRNARIHDSQNQSVIKKSLHELGAGRSILMDADNVLIAGNGVYQQAQELKLPVRIIESDGRELIAIKRTDLKTNDDRRKALAIADNRASDLSVFDDAKLTELFADMETFKDASGFSPEELEQLLANAADPEQSLDEPEIKPEVKFSEELLECHNYIVLYFDNDVDWLQAKTLFDLKTVKDSSSTDESYTRRGIGRVIKGSDAINLLLKGDAQ